MSEIFETAIVLPGVLIILLVFIVQFPLECFRLQETASNYSKLRNIDNGIYQENHLGQQSLVTNNPKELLLFLHWSTDTVSAVEDLLPTEGR